MWFSFYNFLKSVRRVKKKNRQLSKSPIHFYNGEVCGLLDYEFTGLCAVFIDVDARG